MPNEALHLYSVIVRPVAILIVGYATFLSGVAAANDSIEVIPIARYVSEEPILRSYSQFRASAKAGTATYDDTYRHPFLPLGRVVVDCRKAQRVGVTLILTTTNFHRRGHRYPTSVSKDTTIKYIWSHSEHSKKGGRYFSKYRVHPNVRVEVISDGITLREVDKVDGIMSIKILANSDLMYQTSFELVGCESVT